MLPWAVQWQGTAWHSHDPGAYPVAWVAWDRPLGCSELLQWQQEGAGGNVGNAGLRRAGHWHSHTLALSARVDYCLSSISLPVLL